MIFKRFILWYGMLCYPMQWYGMESMVCYEVLMLCYEISMLCYAIVYVVKDKHSATVCKHRGKHNHRQSTIHVCSYSFA